MKKLFFLIITLVSIGCYAANQGTLLTSAQKTEINTYFTDKSINYTGQYIKMTIKTCLRKVIALKTNVIASCPDYTQDEIFFLNSYFFDEANKLILYVPTSSARLTASQKSEMISYFFNDANCLDFTTDTITLNAALNKIYQIHRETAYRMALHNSVKTVAYKNVIADINKAKSIYNMFTPICVPPFRQGEVLSESQKTEINTYFTDKTINYTKNSPFIYMTIKTGLRRIIANKNNALTAISACQNMSDYEKNTINSYFNTANRLILYVPTSSVKLNTTQRTEINNYFIDPNGIDYSTDTIRLDAVLSKLQEIDQTVMLYIRLANGNENSNAYMAIETDSNNVEHIRKMFCKLGLSNVNPPTPPDPSILLDSKISTNYPGIYGVRKNWFRTDIDFYNKNIDVNDLQNSCMSCNTALYMRVDFEDMAIACDPDRFIFEGYVWGYSKKAVFDNLYWRIKQIDERLSTFSVDPNSFIYISPSNTISWDYESLKKIRAGAVELYNNNTVMGYR